MTKDKYNAANTFYNNIEYLASCKKMLADALETDGKIRIMVSDNNSSAGFAATTNWIEYIIEDLENQINYYQALFDKL